MFLTTCGICEGRSSTMREHCPYCGAYYIPRIDPTEGGRYRNVESGREMVRAFSTTFCSDEQKQLEGIDNE